MEVFNGSISTSSKFHPRFPRGRPDPLFTAYSWAKSSKSRRFQCQVSPKLASQIYYPFPNRSVFLISAQYGRRSNRRNYLRRKLSDNLLQLRRGTQNLTTGNEDGFCQTNAETSGLENEGEVTSFSEIDSISEINSGIQNGYGGSVLWDKLKGWSEQYKKDIEFWGVGSGSIFTVSRDSNGKVERVLVDEDEIMRRSGVLPSDSREEGNVSQVGLKLSYAKYVAAEMENGNCMLPESSSVTKFVVSGQSSKWKSEIRNIVMQPNIIPKLSAIGSISVFGFLIIWAVKGLLHKGGKKELKRLEKEMMTRKIKSRKAKEMSMKGSVEIVEESIELDTVVYERPGLDKEELMNSIRNADGDDSSNPLDVLGGSIGRDSPSSDMDEKMLEVKEMVRQVSEMEAEATEVSVNRSTNDVGNGRKQQAQGLNALSNLPNQSSGKLNGASFVVQEDGSEKKLECDLKSSQCTREEEFAEGISNMLTTKSGNSSVCNNEEDNSGLNYVDFTKSSSVSEKEAPPLPGTSMRKKPRVIRSVTEAREYLSSKLDKQAGDKRSPDSDIKYQKDDLAQKVAGEEQLVVTRMSDGSLSSNVSDMSLNVNEDILNAISLNGKAETPNVTEISEDSSVCMRQNVNEEQKMTDSSRSSSTVSASSSNMNTNYNKKYDSQEKNCISAEINSLSMEVHGTAHGINAYKPVLAEETKVDLYESLDNGQNVPHASYGFGSDVSDPVSASNPPEDSGLEEKQCLRENGDVQEKDCTYAKTNGLGVEVQGTEPGITASEPAPALEAQVDSFQNSDCGQRGPNTIHAISSDESGLISAERPLDDSRRQESLCLSAELNIGEPVTIDHDIDDVLAHNAAKNSVNSKENLVIEEAPANKGNWLEKNFNELTPVVEKIAAGFKNNYTLAREKAMQGSNIGSNITELQSFFNDSELEWMNDCQLREIVFRVRDNELAGRDPFHLVSAEDKMTFFRGLEEKVEKANEQVSALHDWLHSNIENLDYGADGISIYDPPEKTAPQWKGPSADIIRELLTKTIEERVEPSTSQTQSSQPSEDFSKENVPNRDSKAQVKVTKKSKTVIESSDGSMRPGRKRGKEYWEHTKKWTKEFLELYNAETDPEVKAVLRDMGKDLDRWVTDEDIKKAQLLREKMPGIGKRIMDKKFSKLKKEVEQFGQKAVVDKYSEYAVTADEDYLWWLDLPYVLCVEMYTQEAGKDEVGFYTVEMATDLELDPKPHHVIAFEDPGNCKNFCHILQTHLEMIGKSKAYVVAQPPKDVFRGAKDNGFGVTVIRKGELTLNIDQPLEEVEELISEIGSKMYHDKIMKQHKIDMQSVMKGMSVASKIERRRNPSKHPKRFKLKKPKKKV